MGEIVAAGEKKKTRRVNEISIYDLVEKGKLTEVQEKLYRVTDMAFATIDYRGKVITDLTGFTKFCASRRNHHPEGKTCCLSGAFGGAAAAISNQPYIYKCQNDLVNIAVPIVIHEQYMGAMIGGQVYCDTDEKIDRFDDRSGHGTDDRNEETDCFSEHEEIPTVSIEKIRATAELAFLYIRQLCEMEEILLEKQSEEYKKQALIEENKRVLEKEKRMEELAAARKRDKMNPHFLMNILNVAAGLAYIEDASQTGEIVGLLVQMIRYQMKPDDEPVSLWEELEHVEHYLKIQKLRFEDKMSYEIIQTEGVGEQMILPNTLLPFVENAVSQGILSRKGHGSIRIICYMDCGDCVIMIEDEGSGFSVKELQKVYEPFRGHYEHSRVSSDIYVTRQRLIGQYGPQYDIRRTENGEQGTRILMRIPQSVERAQYYV